MPARFVARGIVFPCEIIFATMGFLYNPQFRILPLFFRLIQGLIIMMENAKSN
jgi:hypothetical protein